jgi:hypothetical protein
VDRPIRLSRRAAPVQYLALEYRPGETDKKLTFIVQKTRKAEFFVKVPKEDGPPRTKSPQISFTRKLWYGKLARWNS